MPQPRVRYDESGNPKPCKVFVPPNLAQFLYREAMKGRKGAAGARTDETDIVVELIRKWAEQLPVMEWGTVLAELKAEADAAESGAAKSKGSKGKGKKTS